MKRGLGFTTSVLWIITLLFAIVKFVFNIDNYDINPSISLSISLGFWYFLIFAILTLIAFLIKKNKGKRRK